jgi:HSP20 family protein
MLTLWRNHETPFAALSREVNRLYNDIATAPIGAWNGYGLTPAADIAETEASFKVVIDLPGHDPKAIQIQVQDDVLTIQSERKLVEPAKDETVHRSERLAGTSFRSFALPASVDPAKVEATYEDGVLTVVLPKREEARARTIQVNAK